MNTDKEKILHRIELTINELTARKYEIEKGIEEWKFLLEQIKSEVFNKKIT